MKKYTLGIDFGTLSARSVIIDAQSGTELADSTYEYPHGVMSEALPSGKRLKPQSALQHPADYIEALKVTVGDALAASGLKKEDISALAIDFTSCTILPIFSDGTPLCFSEKYADEPNAYVKLWKHHSAQAQADKMNEVAKARDEKWLKIYGGKISSEFLFPKVLEILEDSPEVYEDTYSFIEAGDWLSLVLTGKDTRSVNFAGYKATWVAGSGFPSSEYLGAVDPRLADIVGRKIPSEITPITEDAGVLNAYGASLLGLAEGTPLSLPIIDAQAAIPALNVTRDGEAMLVLGTSGVIILHDKKELDVSGLLGYCDSPIIPDFITYEAGQACLGDGFDWFVKNCVPKSYYDEAEALGVGIHKLLRTKASKLSVGESGVIALDWLGGNRSLLSDSDLSGMILGITLGTKPEEIYRALIEAVAFSTRMIIEAFEDKGANINSFCASGGIALKDEMMMQIYADVLGKEIRVSSAKQVGAYGSAIRAAVSAGIYKDIFEASAALCKPIAATYYPNPDNKEPYDRLYEEYKTLHDYFGRGQNKVMKKLKKISKG